MEYLSIDVPLKKILTHSPQHQNAEKHQDAAKTVEVDLDIVACRCILMDKISGKPLDVVNIVLIAVFEISQVLRRNLMYFLHPSLAIIKRYV